MRVTQPKDYNKFVKVWLEAWKNRESTEYIAKKLHIDKDEVRGSAMYLRNRGVMLPSLKNTVDVATEELNSLISETVGVSSIKW